MRYEVKTDHGSRLWSVAAGSPEEDEARVYGGRIPEGMRMEIAHAEAHGVPVRFVETEAGR